MREDCMDYTEQLKQKMTTAEEALLHIPDNAYLFTYGYGEPVGMLSRMTELKGKRRGIIFVESLNAQPYPFFSDPEMFLRLALPMANSMVMTGNPIRSRNSRYMITKAAPP